MSKARLVITAVLAENRSVAEVVVAYGVSRSWVYELLARYRLEGEAAFEPRSRRPKTSPAAVPADVVDQVLRLRTRLREAGHDAGADTLRWHLEHHHDIALARATIHRILTRHGVVTPEPRKRPKSSYIRFEAAMPNECWQSDFTAGIASTGDFLTAYAASKFGVEGFMEALTTEVAPFGIKTMLVEPGFFRTELLSAQSTNYAEPTIEDYAERTRATVSGWKNMDGKQGGDPAKLADALVRLAALDEPPLRFAAGADAVDLFEAKARNSSRPTPTERCPAASASTRPEPSRTTTPKTKALTLTHGGCSARTQLRSHKRAHA